MISPANVAVMPIDAAGDGRLGVLEFRIICLVSVSFTATELRATLAALGYSATEVSVALDRLVTWRYVQSERAGQLQLVVFDEPRRSSSSGFPARQGGR